MTLQEAYFVSEIVVGVAVIVSIVFVALELRQNSYLLRKSMSADARDKFNWLFELIATDGDFRAFHRRIDTDYENFNEDEKYRADFLAVRTLSTNLNELNAYIDGNILKDDWLSLKAILEICAKRPNHQAAWLFLKDQYPKKVHDYWESLPKS
ncbi:MAG: hypothetical protein VCB07_03395 [Gammaproteobacteria bacterium]